MSAIPSLENLFAWFVQVSVLALLGACLPMLLRIRHPKSQLAYYHLILVVCLVVPLIQPWQHPILLVTGAAAGPAAAAIPWHLVIVSVVVAGIGVKLCWLAVGLLQLRRYRRSALPLYPIPQSIQDARRHTGSDAVFCLSTDVSGPATLGYIDPVVLLPLSFASLDSEAQRSIACHELIHVRRRDWLVTVLEEITCALFWFNPAVRWLLGQAKLTREQLVDVEVVRLTSPAPYIEALLSMAVVTKGRWTVPAAPFFTEGHLVHRMRSLLTNPNRSLLRLAVSYACTVVFLFGAGWSLVTFLPLTGEAQIVTPATPRIPLVLRARVEQPVAVPFNVRVPAPQNPRGPTVIRFMRLPQGVVGGPAPGFDDPEFVLPLAPPPPPPPPPGTEPIGFGVLGQAGVRVILPGEMQGLPAATFFEVIRADDGTVQSFTVQGIRRSVNEANSIPVGDRLFFVSRGPTGAAGATEPTVSTDGVH